MATSWNKIITDMNDELGQLTFEDPVQTIYNPLEYARRAHDQFIRRFGGGTKEAIFLGMNPGPYGMAQTGVPFGEIAHVRDWLGIKGIIDRPPIEHPKRPIQGFECPRREISGQRLWGFFKEKFGEPEAFFARFFVVNYCPLVFMEESGKNRTPDKLPTHEREDLFLICDLALQRIVDRLQPDLIIGVGHFATDRAKAALGNRRLSIGTVLHPSPASPTANRGWAEAAEKQLKSLGIRLP
ncbi:MAG: uracil-DNA glycosylase family protein [Nitrospirales bacterium]